ncbi:MAG: sugar phosphate isomerase/epimerase [Betaproteobacteria bacterium]
MSRTYSLAHLSALPLPPPQLVEVAAAAGYDHVGVRMIAPAPGIAAYPLMDDPAMLRETLARLADSGLTVFDIEIVRINRDFATGNLLPFLETGAKLGARAVLTVAGDEDDPSRLAQSYAAFCAAAKSFGLTADLEFMPWTSIPNAAAAVRLVEAAGSPDNAGVLVDAIHFERSATTLDDIGALPPGLLHYAQICDAPAGIPDAMEEILRQARYERRLPGEGGIDLEGLVRALPAALPIAIECWDQVRTPAMGFGLWARRAIVATGAILAATGDDAQ